MDLGILWRELRDDPLRLGYKTDGVWKRHQDIADLLNAVPATPSTGLQEIVNNQPSSAIIGATVRADYDKLGPADKTYYQTVAGAGDGVIDFAQGPVDLAFTAMFPPGLATNANLNALRKRVATRGQVIGCGAVAPGHVHRAIVQGEGGELG